jgi:hypothetical protein
MGAGGGGWPMSRALYLRLHNNPACDPHKANYLTIPRQLVIKINTKLETRIMFDLSEFLVHTYF